MMCRATWARARGSSWAVKTESPAPLSATAAPRAHRFFDQIQEVLDSKTLPSHLADDLDAVRVIGNLAAHPMKSRATGQIVEVEPGEAEWNLDVIEGLFDFYFVEPERQSQRRDVLNKKLKEAGKPPLR